MSKIDQSATNAPASNPVLWVAVVAGLILPNLTLSGAARPIVTTAVVLVAVGLLVRGRRSGNGSRR